MMETLYIVIPAYNEEANIRQVIEEWYPVIERHNENTMSRLVIIDDGSRDNTYAIIKECAQSRPFLSPITKTNAGHGATILYGYHYALAHNATYIFQTDSDGQTTSDEFEQFWNRKEDYDMVIGHRNHREDGISRIIVTKVLKFIIKLCFGVWITDSNTPFRLMNAASLKECMLLIPNDFYLANVMLSVIYTKKGYRVKYLPITFRARQGGVNSINITRIMKIGKQAWKDFKEINKTL